MTVLESRSVMTTLHGGEMVDLRLERSDCDAVYRGNAFETADEGNQTCFLVAGQRSYHFHSTSRSGAWIMAPARATESPTGVPTGMSLSVGHAGSPCRGRVHALVPAAVTTGV